MAYTYVGALTRASATSADWISTDVSNMAYSTMLETYAEIYIQVSNPAIAGNLYLTDQVLRDNVPLTVPSPTVTAWLASLGNASLPTTTTPAPTLLTPVGYANGWQAGYVAKRTNLSMSSDTASQLPLSDMSDLIITRDGVDMANLSQFILTSVNGYYHLSYGSPQGLCVPHGGKSADLCNQNHFGVTSFYNVGAITQVPITLDMLSNPAANGDISKGVYLTMPNSMDGYVPLLVIGGYLHVLDDLYRQLGDRTIYIDVANISLMERIYQSYDSIDLTSLPLVGRYNPKANPQQFTVQSFYTNALMKVYLTLPQSFVVLVKVSQLYRRDFLLEKTAMPGLVYGKSLMQYPMMGAFGKLMEYRLILDNNTTYVYQSEANRTPIFDYQTVNYRSLSTVSPALTPANQYRPHEARLIEFGTLSVPSS